VHLQTYRHTDRHNNTQRGQSRGGA